MEEPEPEWDDEDALARFKRRMAREESSEDGGRPGQAAPAAHPGWTSQAPRPERDHPRPEPRHQAWPGAQPTFLPATSATRTPRRPLRERLRGAAGKRFLIAMLMVLPLGLALMAGIGMAVSTDPRSAEAAAGTLPLNATIILRGTVRDADVISLQVFGGRIAAAYVLESEGGTGEVVGPLGMLNVGDEVVVTAKVRELRTGPLTSRYLEATDSSPLLMYRLPGVIVVGVGGAVALDACPDEHCA